ncbi:hypothetical protein NDU88_001740 [Pleurodeles waltl]|uniref:Uncharacterized protein n=1 Tax=Pleurodeles waltl TaxID=8319 RepID=A0AAV7LBW6_PLEWA|nr:hypothetical protein NDU88_001740 [Pleurodeles waltl]
MFSGGLWADAGDRTLEVGAVRSFLSGVGSDVPLRRPCCERGGRGGLPDGCSSQRSCKVSSGQTGRAEDAEVGRGCLDLVGHAGGGGRSREDEVARLKSGDWSMVA